MGIRIYMRMGDESRQLFEEMHEVIGQRRIRPLGSEGEGEWFPKASLQYQGEKNPETGEVTRWKPVSCETQEDWERMGVEANPPVLWKK